MKEVFGRLLGWLRSSRTLPGDTSPVATSTPARLASQRAGAFVQIGLDFGTAYLKCVCRDVVRDSAWIHLPQNPESDPPFLIPTAVTFERGVLKRTSHGNHRALPSPKVLLRQVALEQWSHPAVRQLETVLGTSDQSVLTNVASVSSTFLLANILADVRAAVPRRVPGFGRHPDDYVAVNMAIPVADAEKPAVNASFLSVLRSAWTLSARLDPATGLRFDEVEAILGDCTHDDAGDDRCFVYPEVSANVQGFVRSRISREGTYLFNDTGASTVDQSVFIFHRHNGADQLTYLHAAVLSLGSSELERRAAAAAGPATLADIEELRRLKESGKSNSHLDAARREICSALAHDTKQTLLAAKRKLYWSGQLDQSRVIFGGGGHADNPYAWASLQPFRSEIFSRNIVPDTLDMPAPTDLELTTKNLAWMRRLSVAYGLSFERSQLTPFIYPSNVGEPKPEDLWQPYRRRGHAPTKDEV